MKWYVHVLKHYANFEGRSRRQEYWMFALFNFIFLIVAVIIDNILGITFSREVPYGPVYTLYALATFLPGLGVGVRRLHDIGKSGWFILIGLVPCIGGIWLLVLMATDSQPGTNEYGPNPKEPEQPIEFS